MDILKSREIVNRELAKASGIAVTASALNDLKEEIIAERKDAMDKLVAVKQEKKAGEVEMETKGTDARLVAMERCGEMKKQSGCIE